MRHPADANELLEVPGDELRAVVRDDPGVLTGILLAHPLKDRLHLSFLHGLADFPVHDEAALAVEEAAQEEVRAVKLIDAPSIEIIDGMPAL
jgi:hypothetical protein